MKKSTMSILTLVAAGAMLVMPVIFFNLDFGGQTIAQRLGFTIGATGITARYALLIPGLMVFLIGMFAVMISKGVFSLAAMLVVGIGIAYMFLTMDSIGMITPIMKAGLTTEQLGLWIIVLSGLVGSIIAVARR